MSTQKRPHPLLLPLSAGLMAFTLASSHLGAAVIDFDTDKFSFDTDHAVTSAIISGGGYVTDHSDGLASVTSPDWSAGTSLGTYFQRPTWQNGYDAGTPVFGAPGTAVTLGPENNFPEAERNLRDTILLTWDAGFGLENLENELDLAIFEQATSEAFAVRVHNSTTTAWSDWYYQPYESLYDAALDATPTRYDLSVLGVAVGQVINALEITNLLETDTVAEEVGDPLDQIGFGLVYFDGVGDPGDPADRLSPARFSSSQGKYVPIEAFKWDPDIQYVAGLHALASGVPTGISALAGGVGASSVPRPNPTDFTAAAAIPAPMTPLLLLLGLGAIRLSSRINVSH